MAKLPRNRLVSLQQSLTDSSALAQSLTASFHPAKPVKRKRKHIPSSPAISVSELPQHYHSQSYDDGSPIVVEIDEVTQAAQHQSLTEAADAPDYWSDANEDIPHIPEQPQVAGMNVIAPEPVATVEVETLPPEPEEPEIVEAATRETWLEAEAYTVEEFEDEDPTLSAEQAVMKMESQPHPITDESSHGDDSKINAQSDADPFELFEQSLGINGDRAGDADLFEAELQAMLHGQKSMDTVQSVEKPEPESLPTATPDDMPDDMPEENRHAIFDRLGSAMNYATTYDLGSVALEQRFEDVDRAIAADLQREEATPTIVEPGEPELAALDYAEDFALMNASSTEPSKEETINEEADMLESPEQSVSAETMHDESTA